MRLQLLGLSDSRASAHRGSALTLPRLSMCLAALRYAASDYGLLLSSSWVCSVGVFWSAAGAVASVDVTVAAAFATA